LKGLTVFGVVEVVLNGISIYFNGIEHWTSSMMSLWDSMASIIMFFSSIISPNVDFSFSYISDFVMSFGEMHLIQLPAVIITALITNAMN